MGKIFMGFWDCSSCGTKKIRGDVRNCPNCGKPRGNDVRFYMDETSEEVTDVENINKNPDWLCSFCGSLNSDSDETCPSCGHSRDESDLNYFENQEKMNTQHEYVGEPTYSYHDDYGSTTESYSEPVERIVSVSSSVSRTKKRSFNKRKVIIAAAAIALALLIAFIFIPKTRTITVASLPWERTVAVEEYRTVHENSWYLPSGAYDVTTRQEIKSYDHVLDHYEPKTKQVSKQVLDGYDISYSYRDLGNGMFEQVEHKTPRYRTEYHTETYQEPVYKDVPVYATKYYYSIERWVFDHNETASGDDGRAYFPDVTFRSGITRDGGHTEKYWVVDAKEKKYSIDYELWSKLQSGKTAKVKIRAGKITEIIGGN